MLSFCDLARVRTVDSDIQLQSSLKRSSGSRRLVCWYVFVTWCFLVLTSDERDGGRPNFRVASFVNCHPIGCHLSSSITENMSQCTNVVTCMNLVFPVILNCLDVMRPFCGLWDIPTIFLDEPTMLSTENVLGLDACVPSTDKREECSLEIWGWKESINLWVQNLDNIYFFKLRKHDYTYTDESICQDSPPKHVSNAVERLGPLYRTHVQHEPHISHNKYPSHSSHRPTFKSKTMARKIT